jgi:hypothetical protein
MKKIVALALAASFSLGAAQASAAEGVLYPRTVGSGESASIDYGPGPHGNIVGGGVALISGGGEDTTITYQGPVQTQEPMWARAVGNGEDLAVVYSPARASMLTVAAARQ